MQIHPIPDELDAIVNIAPKILDHKCVIANVPLKH